MTKKEQIAKIESDGYIKVRIDKSGQITGYLPNQNYRYDSKTNTGGRRLLGFFDQLNK
jgi:hypothetical protein